MQQIKSAGCFYCKTDSGAVLWFTAMQRGQNKSRQTQRQHGFSEPLVGSRRGRLPETQVTLLSSMRLLVSSGLLPDEMMDILLGDLVVGLLGLYRTSQRCSIGFMSGEQVGN